MFLTGETDGKAEPESVPGGVTVRLGYPGTIISIISVSASIHTSSPVHDAKLPAVPLLGPSASTAEGKCGDMPLFCANRVAPALIPSLA